MIWKYFTGILFVIVILLSFLPPIAGSFDDVYYYSQIDTLKYIPVKAKIISQTGIQDKSGKNVQTIVDSYGNNGKAFFEEDHFNMKMSNEFKIYLLRFNISEANFVIRNFEDIRFFIVFPFIPGLEERARIILFHVPLAWVSVLGFLTAMAFSIRYLLKKNIEDDEKAAVSAGLGLLFCILATLTGSIWAKFSWGSFWNWDPRETSIFILLIIYGAYFALRSAVEIEEKRATLSSIYSILAFITVPFFIFIIPRITAGLHPGSADDISSPGGGPVLKSGMSLEMRIIFFLSLIAFTLLFFWLLEIKVRLVKQQEKKYI
jgi:heme exporter protein C